MTGVFRGKAFAEEHVTEVAVAVFAEYFRTLAIGIWHSPHGASDLVVEARPSAATVEFVIRFV